MSLLLMSVASYNAATHHAVAAYLALTDDQGRPHQERVDEFETAMKAAADACPNCNAKLVSGVRLGGLIDPTGASGRMVK